MTEFAETLRSLLSNDNERRGAAERTFEEAKSKAPAQTVEELFKVIRDASKEEALREQACVLLRQCLGKITFEGSPWSKLSSDVRQQSKAMLLQQFESEVQQKIRRKIADIIESLGHQLIEIEDSARPTNLEVWPELMPLLMRVIMDGSKGADLRADALRTVKELQCTIWPVMQANGQQSLQVLQSCLADTSENVRAYAAALFCDMVDCFPSREERKPFGCLVEPFCQVLAQLADAQDSKLISAVLQAMQGAQESSDFFKEYLTARLLPILKTIAKSHRDEEVQRSALEVLICWCENKPKGMAKVADYIQSTLDVSVHFMMQLDDDVSAWADADDDEEDEKNFHKGKEVIDRLCRAMDRVEQFPRVLEVLKPAITILFQTAEWKQVVAGVTVLAMMAEFIEDVVMLQEMVGAISAQLRAQHPRVRHAAWIAVAQFSEDHSDVMTSETSCSTMLPEFLHGLDEQHKRVLNMCMQAFQHFASEVEREVLEPFVPPMMEKLGKFLQSSMLAVQKSSITFIAVIAGQVEDSFAPYYGPLMPLFKQLIQSLIHNTEERTLLGKVFECVSLLATAVGPDGFRQDAQGIMEAMLAATQVPNLPSSDPVKEYMMAAAERICSTMKADFLPFVPHILPGILEKLTLSAKAFNSESIEDLEEDAEVNLSFVKTEDGQTKIMIMNTSEMEDLQNALSCVHTFIEELGKLYAPYVTATADALLPVLGFNSGEEIRELGFETWGELCNAARESDDAQILSQLVQGFLNRMLPALEEDGDLQARKTKADGVATCLKKAGPNVLTGPQLKHIADAVLRIVAESLKREEVSASDKKQGKGVAGAGDDEDDEADDDEADVETALRRAACEILGGLMFHHPDIFVAEQLEPTLAMVQQLLQRRSVEEDYVLALFVVCDFLDYLKERVTPQWPLFMPQILQGIADPSSAEIRRPACFGVSLAAANPAFAPMAVATAQQLTEVIGQSRGKGTKKRMDKLHQAVADNALSALVQILTHHPEASSPQAWNVWLKGLPCKEDEQESIKNTKVLLTLVQGEKAEVVGEGGANLPHILSILVDVYRTDMADEESSKGIGQLILKIGEARLEQLAGGIKEKQRKKLQRIFKEAQQSAA
eukprot:TRINITY_DN16301_c1_g1_i1.p1 TRINITY_DN16301_c1_g1~~TRINITY_DN16301_c1_g1_i1.p1  ORF type:complete len:1112 (-),score=279.80 TRINITY_DN16301_c1_g1_i1:109-3444(-)